MCSIQKGIFVKLKHLAPTVAFLAVGALTLSACGGTSATGESASGGESNLQGTITGIGASSQKAAMDAWTADFTSANSGVTVNYSPDGSGAGREQFLAGNAQFAGSDAALDDSEAEKAKEVCGPDGAFEFPVYISPIAVAFNVEGVDSLNLSPDTIAKIFKGEITNWNDAAIKADNPDATLPDLKITAVHRADDSGTTENFTDYLKSTAGKVWDQEPDGNFPKSYGGEAAQAPTASSRPSPTPTARSATPTPRPSVRSSPPRSRSATSSSSSPPRLRPRSSTLRRRSKAAAKATSPSTSPATPPSPAPTRSSSSRTTSCARRTPTRTPSTWSRLGEVRRLGRGTGLGCRIGRFRPAVERPALADQHRPRLHQGLRLKLTL